MALGLGSNSTCGENACGSGMSHRTTLPYSDSAGKSSTTAIDAEDSPVKFKRDRSIVRRYVRASTHRLKWTLELHQSFMRAVNQLGGKDKATPKKILEHMNTDGLNIAHVKSHLQMYRTGKINEKGMSNTVTFPVVDRDPAQSMPTFKELCGEEWEDILRDARELHMALKLLKQGRNIGAPETETTLLKTGVADIQAFKQHKTYDTERILEHMETREFAPIRVELNDDYSPTSAPPLCLEPFLNETSRDNNLVDVTDSTHERKRKAEEAVQLNLTMATTSPKLQLPCPSTPEEAAVSLGLS